MSITTNLTENVFKFFQIKNEIANKIYFILNLRVYIVFHMDFILKNDQGISIIIPL